MRLKRTTLLLTCVLVVAACGRDQASDNGTGAGDSSANLPKPEAAGGSVTGMPDKPGPGQVGPPAANAIPSDAPIANDGQDAPAIDEAISPDADESTPGNPGTGADATPVAADEPTPQDAIAVVRDYYAAIDHHDYAHAYTLWSDGGRSSGQTLNQFAGGFTDTVGVSVQTAAPSHIGAAAGSRYIEVPVTISATQRDGSVRQYTGIYTLRRAMVDGATAEQRLWRIGSAQLHEAKP